MIKNRLFLLGLSLAACIALAGPIAVGNAPASAQQDSGKESPEKDGSGKRGEKPSGRAAKDEREAARAKAKWFEKLEKEDRAAVDAAVGFAAPAIPESVEFINANFKDLKELRGKVVVIQTFTSKNAGGLVAVEKTVEKVKGVGTEAKISADDLVLIAIHTPEAADKAKAAIEKRKLELPIVVDADGALCDALGAYRRPIAYIVDRQGNLVGQRIEGEISAKQLDEGIKQALKLLARA